MSSPTWGARRFGPLGPTSNYGMISTRSRSRELRSALSWAMRPLDFAEFTLLSPADCSEGGRTFHPILSPGSANCGSTIVFSTARRRYPLCPSCSVFRIQRPDHILFRFRNRCASRRLSLLPRGMAVRGIQLSDIIGQLTSYGIAIACLALGIPRFTPFATADYSTVEPGLRRLAIHIFGCGEVVLPPDERILGHRNWINQFVGHWLFKSSASSRR